MEIARFVLQYHAVTIGFAVFLDIRNSLQFQVLLSNSMYLDFV